MRGFDGKLEIEVLMRDRTSIAMYYRIIRFIYLFNTGVCLHLRTQQSLLHHYPACVEYLSSQLRFSAIVVLLWFLESYNIPFN
jgi:hypothetical protein